MLLVLSVDRDNDFGEKAGVPGPIVGREANLKAAVALALADPEDSDANCCFGAIQIQDELAREGETVEIVTLTGDRRVGAVSDRRLTRDLEEVLARFRPTRCIFVTDGAEDEFILPLVTSRVKVEAVRRVIVKQNADLEGTYYVIKKALEDDKMQRTFLMPLALGLLVYGVFAVLGKPGLGVGAITITLGVYFLAKVLHLGQAAKRTIMDVYAGFTAGKVSLFTSLLAILVLVAGFVTAGRAVLLNREDAVAVLALDAATSVLWWIVAAALIAAAGKVTDAYVREGVVLYSYSTLPFSLVAAALVLTAALAIGRNLARHEPFAVGLQEALLVLAGFLFSLMGSVVNAVVRQRAERQLLREAFARPRERSGEEGRPERGAP